MGEVELELDRWVVTWKGMLQNGLFASDVYSLEFLVCKLLEKEGASDCLKQVNGWRIRRAKIVYLDEEK